MYMKKARSGLYAAAAVYLLYLAYGLFKGRNDPESTMAPALVILFIVLFALAGGALLVYSILAWNRARAEEKSEEERDMLK